MPLYDKENELQAWNKIKEVALEALTKYPNTVEEDKEILEKDDMDHHLGFNNRNCILYRKAEKDILHYLIFCADKAAELVKLTAKEARQQINLWEGHDKRCEPFFKDVFCPALP